MKRAFDRTRSGSGEQWPQLVGRAREVAGAGLTQLLFATESPQHADTAHAVMARTVDVHVTIPDHPARPRCQRQASQCFANQVLLVAQPAISSGADDVLEMLAERQVREDLARMRLVLRGDYRQPVTVGTQPFDRLADTGAFLEFLEGKTLPAVAALEARGQ